MRRVMVSESKQQANRTWKLEEIGEAFFHQFGVNYEELDGSHGNFTTAIVEWPDGRVENVPVGNIQFLDHL